MFRLRENLGALQCQKDLTSAFLNVDGLSEVKLVDGADFAAQVSPDFFVLLETKSREEQLASDIEINGYDVSEVRRSNAAGEKQGGGLAYYATLVTQVVSCSGNILLTLSMGILLMLTGIGCG